MNHCLRHYEEPVTAHCRACNHPFCTRCLVYSFGPKKPPYCVGCALHASGIRNGQRIVDPPIGADDVVAGAPLVPGLPGADAPVADKRVERAYKRAERDAVKAAAKAAKRAARKGTPPPIDALVSAAPVERTSQVPAPSQLLARASGPAEG